MIYPTNRLVWLALSGALLALPVGVAWPALWLLPLGWPVLLIIAGAVDAMLAPRGVFAAVSVPGVVSVGEDFSAKITLAERGRTRFHVAMSLDPRLASDSGGRADVVNGAGQVQLKAVRRGRAMIGRIDVRWPGPAGLVWCQRRQRLDREVLITPDVRSVRTHAPGLLSRDAAVGNTAQRNFGNGGDFEALTDFQAGMNRRDIDWKRSARHGELLSKEYRDERDNNIVIAFDCGRTMCEPVEGLPRIDRSLSAGLLVAYVSLKHGDRVTLFAFDAQPRVASAALAGVGAFPMLQRLAGQIDYATVESNFTLGLSNLAARLDRRSLIILFTEFVDSTGAELMLRSIGRLLERHVVLFIVLRDDELESLVAARPTEPADVTRAVIAAEMLRDRRIVLTRLQRMGVELLETRWQDLGPALVNKYIATRQERL